MTQIFWTSVATVFILERMINIIRSFIHSLLRTGDDDDNDEYIAGKNPYFGYLSNKKWPLNEAITMHLFYFAQVIVHFSKNPTLAYYISGWSYWC